MAKKRKSRTGRKPRKRNPLNMGYQVRASNPGKRKQRRKRNPLDMGYQVRASNPGKRKRRRKRNGSAYASAVRRGLAKARSRKGRKHNPLDMGYQVRASNPRKNRRPRRKRNPSVMDVLSLGLGGIVGFSAASFLGGLIQRVLPASVAAYGKFVGSAAATAASAFLLPKVWKGGGREFLAPVLIGMGVKAAVDGLGAVLPSSANPLIQKAVGIRSIGSAIPSAVAPGAAPAVAPGAAPAVAPGAAPAVAPALTPGESSTGTGTGAVVGVPAADPGASPQVAWTDKMMDDVIKEYGLSGAYPPWSVGFPGYNNASFPQLAESAPAMSGYYDYKPALGGYYDYQPALGGNPFGEPF